MRNYVPSLRSRLLVRVAAIALASGSVAACSSDSTRFGEDPFANPFSSASASASSPAPARPHREREQDFSTGAVRAAPVDRIERAPLSSPSSAQSRPMYGYDRGSSGGGSNGGGSYRSSNLEPRTTASVRAPRPEPMASADSSWSQSSGTMITVGGGESVHTISARYGVPASAIMKANGLTSANAVSPGQQLLIPTYSASGGGYRTAAAAPAAVAVEQPRPFGSRADVGGVPVTEPRPVAPRATVAVRPPVVAAPVAPRVAVQANLPAAPRIAAPRIAAPKVDVAANLPAAPKVNVAANLPTAPRASVAANLPAAPRVNATANLPAAPKVNVAANLPAAQPKANMRFVEGAQPKAAEVRAAEIKKVEARAPEIKSAEVKPKAPAVAPRNEQAFAAAPAKLAAPAADDNVKTAALKVETPAAAEPTGPSFRWPARGRVISGYGSKSSGASNDGVNIAVPEGTAVKASDDGVVAYSGSELKGFGNLVLIRHSNGWVTAYAHNSALDVKRGDTVRRGQVIAKSGSTGNVSSPQLHFEVRKGAQTVDPMKHLPEG